MQLSINLHTFFPTLTFELLFISSHIQVGLQLLYVHIFLHLLSRAMDHIL
jgi:hypothetical protein